MKSFVLAALASTFALSAFASPAANSPAVTVVGVKPVNGVYVIQEGDPITLQFQKGSWVIDHGTPWVPVSATTNSIQMPYKSIPLDDMVNPYMFCSGNIGATNVKNPHVTVMTKKPTPPVSHEYGFVTGKGIIGDGIDESNFSDVMGMASWLSPDSSGLVTVSFDLDHQPAKGPIEFNLNLATRTAHIFKFYLTKSAIKEGIPFDGGFMRPRYIEAKHGGHFDDLIDRCVQPNTFLKIRIERP